MQDPLARPDRASRPSAVRAQTLRELRSREAITTGWLRSLGKVRRSATPTTTTSTTGAAEWSSSTADASAAPRVPDPRRSTPG